MKPELGQWMTPVWASERLVETQFPNLGVHDLVIEPTCGDGSFLLAIPEAVQAIGCEIDPVLAERARTRSGRAVVTGDFRTASLPLTRRATLVLGNPPFQSDTVAGILKRSFELLEPDGEVGLILPAYILQSSAVVMKYAERWSLQAELLPRTIFPRLSKALVFARFRKSEQRTMVGFALFRETAEVQAMAPESRHLLTHGPARSTGRSVWFAVVDQAMDELGGEAGLDAIYATVSPRRPTPNPFWQEKVRQVLQQRFIKTGTARYARRSPSVHALAA